MEPTNHIDYNKISKAIDFYQSHEYQLIQVPWTINEQAYAITSENHQYIKSPLGHHVASAEQSFLELILNNQLEIGKYVACTPCFRDNEEDELHQKYFLKVELINFLGHNHTTQTQLDYAQKISNLVLNAKEFFNKYTPTKTTKTDIGIDITTQNDIELGSYGYRSHEEIHWIYGTGLAEPRLSYCLNQEKKGYHLKDIAKEKIGTAQKIGEEVEELFDSLKQDNPIMALIELSDTIGAIEMFLETKFQGTITLEDLIRMKNTTKRAFVNKKR